MARRKKHHKPPVLIDTAPQPTTVNGQLKPMVQGGPVILFSTDPPIQVEAKLRAPVLPPVPRPKISIVDRPGAVSFTHYDGRDPYIVTLPIMFDGYGGLINEKGVLGEGMRSVEREIELLESLAIRHPGDDSTPVIRTIGPVPDPTGDKSPQWRVYGFEPLQERTLFNDGGHRCRWAVDVTLIEAVEDRVLESSILTASSSQPAVAKRRYIVRAGDSWHSIAKKLYGDRSKAKALARANNLTLNSPLKAGDRLIVP